MIQVKNFFNFLKKNKIDFFSGVPDSVLKDTKEILSKKSKSNHLVVSNEGLGVATCIGYYLSKKFLVCICTPGLGNAIPFELNCSSKGIFNTHVNFNRMAGC